MQFFRRSKNDSQDKDLGSIKRLNIVIYTSVMIGIFISFTQYGHININHYFIQLSSLVLILLGLVVRWMAILTLRRYFTVNVAIHADHIIIRFGCTNIYVILLI